MQSPTLGLANMSIEGTPLPILSYKKGQKVPKISVTHEMSSPQLLIEQSRVSSPIVSAPGTPTLGGTRKVSSRRKALQEFYNLQEADSSKAESVGKEEDGEKEKENGENGNRQIIETSTQDGIGIGIGIDIAEKEAIHKVDVDSLADPAQLEKYIKSATIGDILKLRNSAANKLNHHDVEKKSIIYDNYYELIKLSQVLSNLDVDTAVKSKITDDVHDEPKVSDKYVNDVLGDLQVFLQDEGAVYNLEFVLVVETIRNTMDDADSVASVQGIPARD